MYLVGLGLSQRRKGLDGRRQLLNKVVPSSEVDVESLLNDTDGGQVG